MALYYRGTHPHEKKNLKKSHINWRQKIGFIAEKYIVRVLGLFTLRVLLKTNKKRR